MEVTMTDETLTGTRSHDLISSLRVEGTPVFDRRGEKMGSIHSVMLDKVSGQAAYAVLSFGGFLGFGTRVYPVPWSMLTYDKGLHGYYITVTREDIEAAPYMELDKADRPIETAEPVYRHWDQYL
jgi:sporulation protein YlmC with PRC-barrel domain